MEGTVPENLNTWSSMRHLATVLGLLFVVMVIATWIKPPQVLALLLLKPQNHQKKPIQEVSPSRTDNASPDLQQQLDQLKERSKADAELFAAQKEEMEYLTHLIEAMMTVAGIFALFLAAASWTALEGQRKAAQQELTDLRGK